MKIKLRKDCAYQSLAQRLQDLKGYRLAEKTSRRIAQGKEKTYTLK